MGVLMAEEQELVVKVEPEETPPKKEAEDAELLQTLQQQLETSKADIERERQTRLEAEKRAQEERQARTQAEQESVSAQKEVSDSRLATVEQGIAAATAQAEAAERAYASAMQEGKWDDAAKHQRLMSRSEAEIVRLNEAKADIETRKEEPQQQRRQPKQWDNPVEAFVSGNNRASEAQNWLRSHQDYWAKDGKIDQRSLMRIDAGHNMALAEGHAMNSPSYFAYVEKFLGMTNEPESPKNGSDKSGEVKVAAHTRKVPSAPVAPVSSAGGVAGSASNEVRLTKREAESATDGTLVWNYDSPDGKFKKGSPIGIQEMARRKKAMTEQGLYDKSLTEQ